MGVVLASPVLQEPHIFAPVLESWLAVEGVDEIWLFDDGSPKETLELAMNANKIKIMPSGEPQRSTYKRTAMTHIWQEGDTDRMGRIRNRILYKAEDCSDHVLMCDSDIMLAPSAAKELLAQNVPIVSPIFWTRIQEHGEPFPQVWDYHPSKFKGVIAERFEELQKPGLHEVGGLGAVTLLYLPFIRSMQYGEWYSPLPSLSKVLWGEDRYFCTRASCAGIPLYGLATDPPLAYHIYRDRDLKGIAAWKAAWEKKA